MAAHEGENCNIYETLLYVYIPLSDVLYSDNHVLKTNAIVFSDKLGFIEESNNAFRCWLRAQSKPNIRLSSPIRIQIQLLLSSQRALDLEEF